MPIEDFATKQDIEALNTKFSELEKQNQEVMTALKDLSKNVKDGYIQVKAEEGIPSLSQIHLERMRMTQELNQSVDYVKKRAADIEHKLETYGNIKKAVKHEAFSQVTPIIQEVLRTEDTKTASELKKNRYAYLTSILASLGLFIAGATICVISILKLL